MAAPHEFGAGVDLAGLVGQIVEVLVRTESGGIETIESHIGVLVGTHDVWKEDAIHQTEIHLSGAHGWSAARTITLDWARNERLRSAHWLAHPPQAGVGGAATA